MRMYIVFSPGELKPIKSINVFVWTNLKHRGTETTEKTQKQNSVSSVPRCFNHASAPSLGWLERLFPTAQMIPAPERELNSRVRVETVLASSLKSQRGNDANRGPGLAEIDLGLASLAILKRDRNLDKSGIRSTQMPENFLEE